MSKRKISISPVNTELIPDVEKHSAVKTINGIEIRNPESKNETKWFSYLKKLVDAAPYGSVDIKMTVKGGKVTNIKVKSEESFSVHNA